MHQRELDFTDQSVKAAKFAGCGSAVESMKETFCASSSLPSKRKFGRQPEPNDPVFLIPMRTNRVLCQRRKSTKTFRCHARRGTPPEIGYAFKKTGMLLLDNLRSTYPAEVVREWDAAIDEYFAMEVDRKHSDAPPINHDGPNVLRTKIPELQAIPPTAEDQRFIFTCLGAIDEHLEKQPTSLRVKIELAAAVLVMGHPLPSMPHWMVIIGTRLMRAMIWLSTSYLDDAVSSSFFIALESSLVDPAGTSTMPPSCWK